MPSFLTDDDLGVHGSVFIADDRVEDEIGIVPQAYGTVRHNLCLIRVGFRLMRRLVGLGLEANNTSCVIRWRPG